MKHSVIPKVSSHAQFNCIFTMVFHRSSSDHINATVRAWYSTNLIRICPSTDAEANGDLQDRITRLDTKRNGLLSQQQGLAWKTRRICLTSSSKPMGPRPPSVSSPALAPCVPPTPTPRKRTWRSRGCRGARPSRSRSSTAALRSLPASPARAPPSRPRAPPSMRRRRERRRSGGQEREALDQTEALFRLRRPNRTATAGRSFRRRPGRGRRGMCIRAEIRVRWTARCCAVARSGTTVTSPPGPGLCPRRGRPGPGHSPGLGARRLSQRGPPQGRN